MPRIKKSDKKQKKLSTLYVLAFLLSVSAALPAYIQSNFLGQFVSLPMISLIFIAANIVSIISILIFPHLIKTTSNYFLTKIVLILYFASLLGLTLASSPAVAITSIVIMTVSSNLFWINMDILVEGLSSDKFTGKIRTTYFTFMNAGWIVSPILTSYLISKGEYALSFISAAALTIPFFIIFTRQKKNYSDNVKYQKEPLLVTMKKMWRQKNLRNIFFIAFLLQVFYSSAVIYIPIYLYQNLGMGWEIIGPIFSLMLLPLVLIELPAGIIADKYWGEKELLFCGFLILITSLFLFYYIEAPLAWLWLVVLFFSRCGAALVEAMRETYFFKLVDVKNIGYINIFRIASPLAYVLSSMLALVVIAYLPINYLFLVLAVIMVSGLGFTLGLKDTK